DNALLEKAADILLKAGNPLIITAHAGRNPRTVPRLVTLAEALGAPVQTANFWMNFPSTHPLAACLNPGDRSPDPYLTTADVILAIDYDMHYAAPPTVPRPDARIVHIDIDTAKKGVPLWGRKPDILIPADSHQAIPALTGILKRKLTAAGQKELKARAARLSAEHQERRKKWTAVAREHSRRKPISAHWLSHCLDELIDEDTLIVNQTISPSAIVAHHVRRTRPGTLFSCPGGCIGWASGAALGVKLAAPEKTVVSLMGDGAFIYGCPEASLWAAGFYRAPYLSVIFDNQGYAAIKGLFREKYDVDNMGADISSPPDYAMIARACHAYGRTVEDPAEVVPALKEALAEVKKGRSAVLDVRIDPV
ncbi:MAG TPA: thiamine pyrophosphate-dependent enzyme, partial [Dehalococcoidales bacterium]|nr:thiamine pyrophosphate-dependent enzyme [Dehalococcoidales bacterium]